MKEGEGEGEGGRESLYHSFRRRRTDGQMAAAAPREANFLRRGFRRERQRTAAPPPPPLPIGSQAGTMRPKRSRTEQSGGEADVGLPSMMIVQHLGKKSKIFPAEKGSVQKGGKVSESGHRFKERGRVKAVTDAMSILCLISTPPARARPSLPLSVWADCGPTPSLLIPIRTNPI